MDAPHRKVVNVCICTNPCAHAHQHLILDLSIYVSIYLELTLLLHVRVHQSTFKTSPLLYVMFLYQ